MSSSRIMFSITYCGVSTRNQQHEGCLLPRKFQGESGGVSRLYCSNLLSLRGCLNKQDGVLRRKRHELGKAHAMSQYHRLLHDTNVGLGIHAGTNLVNGQGISKHENGPPVEDPGHPLPEKLNVAVDVDEVLGSFLSSLNKFIADNYLSNHSITEYYVYEFFKVWNCSRAEANIRVHEFFKTSYFEKGIQPIPGARRVLDKLSSLCNLSIVTSRQNAIKEQTLEWIESHYPGLFKEIHFGNHFALDGRSRPKSEICRSLGAKVLIDDNPRYALDCAEVGIRVLLFDYDNSYPWSKSEAATKHQLVTKVHNWDEVEQCLLSLVGSCNSGQFIHE